MGLCHGGFTGQPKQKTRGSLADVRRYDSRSRIEVRSRLQPSEVWRKLEKKGKCPLGEKPKRECATRLMPVYSLVMICSASKRIGHLELSVERSSLSEHWYRTLVHTHVVARLLWPVASSFVIGNFRGIPLNPDLFMGRARHFIRVSTCSHTDSRPRA